MNISKPEPEKGSIKVMTNCVPSGSSADGLVKGTDPHAYLGHFRSPSVIKAGHNQGAPGLPGGDENMASRVPGGVGMPTPTLEGGGGFSAPGAGVPALGRVKPVFNATTNPIAATRQQNRADVAAAKLSGTPGAVKSARKQNRADMGAAVGLRKERNALGLRGADRASLKSARTTARTENKALAKVGSAVKQTERKAAVAPAKATLQAATQGLHAARQAVRGAVKGVRTARRGKY